MLAEPIEEKESIEFREKYKKGYKLPPHLKSTIKAAHQTSFTRAVATALSDLAAVALAERVFVYGLKRRVLVAPVLLPVSSLVVSRSLRGLENLIHEASHYNWENTNRVRNDSIAKVLACVPAGETLETYRANHLLHHGRFGTTDDPDLQRYQQLGLEHIDRSAVAPFLRDALRTFKGYRSSWGATSGKTPTRSLGEWGVVLIPAAVELVRGRIREATLSAGFMAFTKLLLHPALRMIAEADEHRYSKADTVFDATISNLGLVHKILIHPHGDGYHTVHHLWPGIPYFRVAQIHKKLVAEDPWYAANLQTRTRILQEPKTGIIA